MPYLIENHQYPVEPYDADGSKWRYCWEPLEPVITLPPLWARPHCCYLDTVVFYDRHAWEDGNIQELARAKHDIRLTQDTLIQIEGIWYKVLSGACHYRDGQWWMRWLVASNSREAQEENWKLIQPGDRVSFKMLEHEVISVESDYLVLEPEHKTPGNCERVLAGPQEISLLVRRRNESNVPDR